jgi:hypothetical protein
MTLELLELCRGIPRRVGGGEEGGRLEVFFRAGRSRVDSTRKGDGRGGVVVRCRRRDPTRQFGRGRAGVRAGVLASRLLAGRVSRTRPGALHLLLVGSGCGGFYRLATCPDPRKWEWAKGMVEVEEET